MIVVWTKTAQIDRQSIYEYWNKRTYSKDYSNKLNAAINNRIEITQVFPDSGLETEFNGIKYHLIDDHYKLFYKIIGEYLVHSQVLGCQARSRLSKI